jgi:hypothetical protein
MHVCVHVYIYMQTGYPWHKDMHLWAMNTTDVATQLYIHKMNVRMRLLSLLLGQSLAHSGHTITLTSLDVCAV